MSFHDPKASIDNVEYRTEHKEGGFKTQRVPLPHELTAEWTVKAQLKFAKAGKIVKTEFNSDDTVHPVRVIYKWNTLDGSEKNDDFNYDNDKVLRESHSRSSAQSQDPTMDALRSDLPKEENLRSPTSSDIFGDMVGADSAFNSSSNSSKRQKDNFYGTRCQSTCNISVTAIADFLPPPDGTVLPLEGSDITPMHVPENDSESFVFKTTANYIAPPQSTKARTIDFSIDKHINQRDAICQTSDTETKYSDDVDQKRSLLERCDSRRLYDYRKLRTDKALKQNEFRGRTDGGNYFKPSYTSSTTTQTSKSRTVHHIPEMAGESTEASGKRSQSFTESQKKPRTVHIDVYCTGSEDDCHADGESSSDDNNKKVDQESNSTFQTVLENEQMRLSHHRITGASLPRRLAEQQNMPENVKNINIGHALTKSNTAEEVNESKQLLFRKHLGDQRAAKLQNIRQKYLRQFSDDTISLEYPNSSRSTLRDNTCSSISSALVESSWKEADDTEDPSYSLAKSDSFEYENALDRLRIRQMEHLWSRNCSNDEEIQFQHHLHTQPPGNRSLQTISELTSSKRNLSCSSNFPKDILPDNKNLPEINDNFYRTISPVSNCKLQQISHFPRNTPGFLQFFGPRSEVQCSVAQARNEDIVLQQHHLEPLNLHSNYNPYLQRWKSETRENLSSSETPLLTPTEISRQPSPQPCLGRSASETPLRSTDNTFTTTTQTFAKRFDIHDLSGRTESEASVQTPPFGYSLEYLDKAKIFGKVVAARKPGHHVGPTKNPNCSCECCQRWLRERFQSRGRLFSLGELPVLKRPS